MKMILCLMTVMLLVCGGAYAETAATDFDGLFTMVIPETWQRQPLTSAQAEAGIAVCYSDGAHFMTVRYDDYSGEYADMQECCDALMENAGMQGAFVSRFGGVDFALYTNLDAAASECAVIVSENTICTMAFYPIDGDLVHGQLIVDMLDTFTLSPEMNFQ